MAPSTSARTSAARFFATSALVALACAGSASAKGSSRGRPDVRIQLGRQEQPSQAEEVVVTSSKDEKDAAAVPAVLGLNHYTFPGNVLSGPKHASHWVVVFCPNWWEPCQNIAKPYADLATEWQGRLNQDLLTSEVRFAHVDCAVDKVLCNEQDVDGYPTVNLYVGGQRTAKWMSNQKNDVESLTKWLNKRLGAISDSSKIAAGNTGGIHEVLSSYLVPGGRAADVLLALLGLAASFRLVLSNPELWEKGGSSRAARAGPTATPATSDAAGSAPAGGSRLRRLLPEEWRASRGSVEL